MTTKKIELRNFEETRAILGERDEFLQLIDEKFNCRIVSRGNFIELFGEDLEVEQAAQVIDEIKKLYRRGTVITMNDVAAAVKLVKNNRAEDLQKLFGETIIVTARGVHIHAKSTGQQNYIDTIK
ncbi:MAG: phosphate starvation-inducible protein PhoH, partial [Selenomonadaceae bacterium]|nr:phosphate starvation-inducible protein PhoH [Selenomonadaceae bacterium]